VFLQPVAGEGLDDHPRAIRFQCVPHVRGGAYRVPHVVQAIEGGYEVVPGAAVALGARRLETDPFRDSRLPRALARHLYRWAVVVEAVEGRAGVALCHEYGRGAIATSYIRRPCAGFQPVLHAIERRDPRLDQVGGVVGAEEPLGPVKEPTVMLVPPYPLA